MINNYNRETTSHEVESIFLNKKTTNCISVVKNADTLHDSITNLLISQIEKELDVYE